jgi:alkylhydroperoxidase family enzyme
VFLRLAVLGETSRVLGADDLGEHFQHLVLDPLDLGERVLDLAPELGSFELHPLQGIRDFAEWRKPVLTSIVSRMPRVPEQEELLPVPFNIFRALGHAPTVTKGFSSMGSRLLNETELDVHIRELVINSISLKLHAPYEWSHHARWLLDAGGSTDELEALKSGDLSSFGPLERACLEFANKVEDTSVTDADVDGLRKAGLSDRQIVELTMLVGFYGMTARFLLAMDVGIDEGNPDGFALPEAVK